MPMDAGEIELIIRIILQVLLLMGSAFFSGSETALFSLSRIHLQRLRNARDPASEGIHALLGEPRRLIISILCGNELVNIASAANMAAILITLFGAEEAGWINILVMVPLLLLVGEVTPKTIAVTFPVGYAKNVSSRFLPRWIWLITPLRESVRLVADRVTTLIVGESVKGDNLLQRDELRTLLEEGEETGAIEATERVLIDNLLEASNTEISHIMTPGPRIRFLDAGLPMRELIEQFRRHRHPRIPVYSGHWDNVIGFLYSEDVLRLMRGGADLDRVQIQDLLRPVHFVPPTIKVNEMFDFFQTHNTRAVIVLGEFGEVMGIVTIKDVLRFIFGEITSPMGSVQDHERDGVGFIVPGDMRLLDFYNLTNIDITDPVMTTVGGVVFRLFGRLPTAGEQVIHDSHTYMVLQVERMRIARLRVTPVERADLQEEALAESPEGVTPEQASSVIGEGLETAQEPPADHTGPDQR
ncbi:MAG: HlyC/CorC family transporter [Sphingobacteriia bacterium]|nr:HlyC/CorC family transporter [Sphingobacteriia bacterium]NCC38738.1 HlyC/CorC family transporter [Gammaproteobacteria bacterium]